jgi:phenol/toluene 2-monooxygenase (NADH) P3/A3
VYKDETYHFCSDGCQHIFEHEPEKYVQAWLPMPQLFQEPVNGDLGEWMKWVSLLDGKDNGDYAGSEDQKNFETWRGMATSNQ